MGSETTRFFVGDELQPKQSFSHDGVAFPVDVECVITSTNPSERTIDVMRNPIDGESQNQLARGIPFEVAAEKFWLDLE